MNIREADINDAPGIARVVVDTWKSAYRGIISDDYLNNLSYQEREKGWREFPWDNSFVFVAEDDGKNVIGFVAGGPERESRSECQGEVYAIYVYQSHQYQGIGSLLFRALLRKLEQTGIHSLLVWVLTDSPFRRFYERQGGQAADSKLLEMEGFTNDITAYGWSDIRKVLNLL
ncbi:MAG TPA: GNAT family N-acetyltransferase [Syntrophomonadaceae bacterium]|nr:GNAT family N-acetyltransferase [Syntrophomonadaceae bacterium]